MRKKLLAVLMTGAMVASFAGSATAVFAKSDDDNKLTVWAWDQNFNIKSIQITNGISISDLWCSDLCSNYIRLRSLIFFT